MTTESYTIKKGPWRKKRTTILASSSKVVHLIPEGVFRVVHYHLTFYNETEDKTKSLSLMVNKENGTVKSVVSNKKGSVSVNVDADIVSGNLEVSITNNETYDIKTQFAYLKMG